MYKLNFFLHNRSPPRCNEIGDLHCFSSLNKGQSYGTRPGLQGQCIRNASNPRVRGKPCVVGLSCWKITPCDSCAVFCRRMDSCSRLSVPQQAGASIVLLRGSRLSLHPTVLELICLSEQFGVSTAFQLLF